MELKDALVHRDALDQFFHDGGPFIVIEVLRVTDSVEVSLGHELARGDGIPSVLSIIVIVLGVSWVIEIIPLEGFSARALIICDIAGLRLDRVAGVLTLRVSGDASLIGIGQVTAVSCPSAVSRPRVLPVPFSGQDVSMASFRGFGVSESLGPCTILLL